MLYVVPGPAELPPGCTYADIDARFGDGFGEDAELHPAILAVLDVWPGLDADKLDVLTVGGSEVVRVPRAVLSELVGETYRGGTYEPSLVVEYLHHHGGLHVRAYGVAGVPELIALDPAPRFEGLYVASDAKGRQA